ncbi:MAG: hypothetical protein U0T81_00995 [Saprospiraceae bacterium]
MPVTFGFGREADQKQKVRSAPWRIDRLRLDLAWEFAWTSHTFYLGWITV